MRNKENSAEADNLFSKVYRQLKQTAIHKKKANSAEVDNLFSKVYRQLKQTAIHKKQREFG